MLLALALQLELIADRVVIVYRTISRLLAELLYVGSDKKKRALDITQNQTAFS